MNNSLTIENFDNRCGAGKWWSFTENKCIEQTIFTPEVKWFDIPNESTDNQPKTNDRFWLFVLIVFLLLGILYGFFKFKSNE